MGDEIEIRYRNRDKVKITWENIPELAKPAFERFIEGYRTQVIPADFGQCSTTLCSDCFFREENGDCPYTSASTENEFVKELYRNRKKENSPDA